MLSNAARGSSERSTEVECESTEYSPFSTLVREVPVTGPESRLNRLKNITSMMGSDYREFEGVVSDKLTILNILDPKTGLLDGKEARSRFHSQHLLRFIDLRDSVL